jgi:hypothetical protein
MSLLAALADDLCEHAKTMPEGSTPDDSDFEAWGRGYCQIMVNPCFFGFLA